jgi:hypothetical protein
VLDSILNGVIRVIRSQKASLQDVVTTMSEGTYNSIIPSYDELSNSLYPSGYAIAMRALAAGVTFNGNERISFNHRLHMRLMEAKKNRDLGLEALANQQHIRAQLGQTTGAFGDGAAQQMGLYPPQPMPFPYGGNPFSHGGF